MPEWIELVREGGPLAVVSVIAIYLLLQNRNNKKADNPGNPGNWQQEMRDAQRQTNATLGRIEESTKQSVHLLTLIEDRLPRERE